MRLYKTAISLLMCATAGALGAQNLSQELEVQHNIDLEHHEAGRMALSPRLMLPQISAKPLSFSERTISVMPPRSISFLEPMAFADTLATSPWNGYASLAYFPVYNLGASAGYRLLDNEHHRLNVWAQFDGCSYDDNKTVNPLTAAPYLSTISRNTVTAGANYHLLVGRRSELDAGLDYTFARFNTPAELTAAHPSAQLYWQSVNRVNAQVQWMSAIQGLQYTAGVDYGYFGYGTMADYYTVYTPLDPGCQGPQGPVRENRFTLNGAAVLSMSDNSAVYLGIDFSFVGNSRAAALTEVTNGNFEYHLQDIGRYNHSVLSIKPRYRVGTDNFKLTVGALIQGTFNSGKFFHIAPEANVAWTPKWFVTVWGRATGGEHQNNLSGLYDINYMMAPMMAYRNSHVPLDVEGGATVGPFKGAYLRGYFAWAAANNWMMPIVAAENGYALTMFRGVNLRGWKAGVEIGVKYRHWIDFKASGEMAPHSYSNAWYQWRDRARFVVSASAESHPVERLTVGVSYELRSGRRLCNRSTFIGTDGSAYMVEETTPLGSISLLGVKASYKFTERVTLFAHIDNILNNRAQMLSLLPSQGINGLVGAAFQF